MADSKGGSREFHLPPPPLTHQTCKYWYYLSDTKILPKTGWHITIQLEVFKINLFWHIPWLLMALDNKKKIIKMTIKELSKSTTTQSKIPRSAPMLCSSTNQNQLTLLDKRHYGGKVSHPKVDLIANPSEFNHKIVDYHLAKISRVYCRSLLVALLPCEVKLRLSLLKK